MALLVAKVPFWVFPRACWNPYFCSIWWLRTGTKRTVFPKQILATKMRAFSHLPNTTSVCLLKNAISAKKYLLCSQPPQKLFSVFLFMFSTFLYFLFSFSNIKKTKCTFFRLRCPKQTIRLGKNKPKKILDQVLTQPWAKFWLKKTQILDQVLTLQHISLFAFISCPVLSFFLSFSLSLSHTLLSL